MSRILVIVDDGGDEDCLYIEVEIDENFSSFEQQAAHIATRGFEHEDSYYPARRIWQIRLDRSCSKCGGSGGGSEGPLVCGACGGKG